MASEEQIKMAEELLFSGKPKTSFAKLLYFGIFDSKRISPFPQVAPEERPRLKELLAKLKTFAEQTIDPDWIDRHATIPSAVIEGLGKLGLLGLTIPKEHAGMGFSQFGYCQTVELIARRCASTALLINAHHSIGVRALLLFGTPEQRQKWLPSLARGEILGAFSLTEPNAGSDAANVQTRAVYDPAKDVYRITGKKQWTTNGSIAKVLTVMAKTEIETPEGRKGRITAFLVAPDMPGFKVTTAALEKVGMRGTTTSNLEFQDMEVPAKNILGPLGGGLKVALTVLDFGRTTFGASCTGIAKELQERAVKHAASRYQFDRPLASFALVKRKISTIASLTYAMDATTYMTASMIDRGEEDFMLETAIVKVFCSEALWKIIYETMQILGGRSFFTDAPYERMMRDARLNTIGEGSNEVLRAFIGVVGMRDVGKQLENLTKVIEKPLLSANNLFRFSMQMAGRVLSTPKTPFQSPEIASEARQLSLAVRRFGFAIIKLLAKHRENIVERQIALDRIATSAIAIYTTTSVLSKLDSDLAAQGSKAMEDDLAVGKLYCQEAMVSLNEALNSLFKNNDQEVEALSDRLSRI